MAEFKCSKYSKPGNFNLAFLLDPTSFNVAKRMDGSRLYVIAEISKDQKTGVIPYDVSIFKTSKASFENQ